jgi:hypothetical protein
VTGPLRQGENVTGNGSASPNDLIIAQDAILAATSGAVGAVNLLRRDMNRRFKETGARLDDVCLTVDGLARARDIETALKAQTKEIGAANEARADRHGLSLRWRVGIGVTVAIPAFAQLWPIALAAARHL